MRVNLACGLRYLVAELALPFMLSFAWARSVIIFLVKHSRGWLFSRCLKELRRGMYAKVIDMLFAGASRPGG